MASRPPQTRTRSSARGGRGGGKFHPFHPRPHYFGFARLRKWLAGGDLARTPHSARVVTAVTSHRFCEVAGQVTVCPTVPGAQNNDAPWCAVDWQAHLLDQGWLQTHASRVPCTACTSGPTFRTQGRTSRGGSGTSPRRTSPCRCSWWRTSSPARGPTCLDGCSHGPASPTCRSTWACLAPRPHGPAAAGSCLCACSCCSTGPGAPRRTACRGSSLLGPVAAPHSTRTTGSIKYASAYMHLVQCQWILSRPLRTSAAARLGPLLSPRRRRPQGTTHPPHVQQRVALGTTYPEAAASEGGPYPPTWPPAWSPTLAAPLSTRYGR